MDRLDRELTQLADSRNPRIRGLDILEARVRSRKRRVAALQMVAVAAVTVAAVPTFQRLGSDNSAMPGRRSVQAPAAAAPTPSASPTGLTCGSGGTCESGNEKLADAEAWLGSVLDAAALAYQSSYRPDGGGGHFVPPGQFLVSALRPTEPDPALEASEYGHEPVASHGGTVIYGSTDSSIWYFYWRAGNVDMFAETVWPPSRRENLPKLRELFGRVIDAANKHPHSG